MAFHCMILSESGAAFTPSGGSCCSPVDVDAGNIMYNIVLRRQVVVEGVACRSELVGKMDAKDV